jgi:hypothetical protein
MTSRRSTSKIHCRDGLRRMMKQNEPGGVSPNIKKY